MAVAVAVAVSVAVAVAVAVGVAVAVAVAVAVLVAVAVSVGVAVAVAVAVGVSVAVAVGVAVAVSVAVCVLVAVGVAVATAPVAMPTREADWVLRCASSVNVSFPVSLVPAGLLSVTGLNVTETWQVELAGTEPSQLLEVIANGPLVAIELKVTATAFELVRVTVCGAEIVPTWTFPYDRWVGERVGVTMMPVPDTAIDCVVTSASSVTTTFADRTPV